MRSDSIEMAPPVLDEYRLPGPFHARFRPSTLVGMLGHLTNRDLKRSKAEIQTDVCQLFLAAPFQLEVG